MKKSNNKILSVLLEVAKNAVDGKSSLGWKQAIVPVYRMLMESNVLLPVRAQKLENDNVTVNILFLSTEYGAAMPIFVSAPSGQQKFSLIPISFVDVCDIVLGLDKATGVIVEPFESGLFISKETILCLMDKSLVLQDDGTFIKI